MKKLCTIFLSVLFLGLLAGFSYAGVLKIDGSTTVLPITQKVAEVFHEKNPEIRVFVSGTGSGTGIRGLMDGITEIAASSRAARATEIEAAKGKGIELTQHTIALDGIIPIVHPSMGIDNLTAEQLRDIYIGKINNWTELGGPNRPITVISRDTASGTFEVWEDKILQGDKVRPDALLSASSGLMVRMVAGNKFAIGYVGIGYLDKDIKALRVNDKIASPASVRDGSWPIARPLFMYTNGKPTGTIAKFMDFMLSKEGQDIVEEVKFVRAF